jgi:hypothetical protein
MHLALSALHFTELPVQARVAAWPRRGRLGRSCVFTALREAWLGPVGLTDRPRECACPGGALLRGCRSGRSATGQIHETGRRGDRAGSRQSGPAPTAWEPHARTSRGATARDGLGGRPCEGRSGSWLAVSLRTRNGPRRPEPVGAGRAESAADRVVARCRQTGPPARPREQRRGE